jgi:hypothetical protein
VLAGPPGAAGAAAAGPAVVVVVPKSGTPGPAERAEITGGTNRPEPMVRPATIDSAAAATAPDAMKRLRAKYGLGAATIAGMTESSGSGCPNVRDVKTSSKVASPLAPPTSCSDPPMTLQSNRPSGLRTPLGVSPARLGFPLGPLPILQRRNRVRVRKPELGGNRFEPPCQHGKAKSARTPGAEIPRPKSPLSEPCQTASSRSAKARRSTAILAVRVIPPRSVCRCHQVVGQTT